MRKKVLALLLGGMMAIGGLFVSAPATVQAEDDADDDADDLVSQGWQEWAATHSGYCSGLSDAHIKSSDVTLVNGCLTVTLQVEFPDKPSGADYGYGGAVYVCEEQWQPTENIGGSDTEYYDYLTLASKDTTKKYFNECDGGNYDGEGAFTLTFDGLASGKTYYVYCYVYDTHGWGEKETYGLHWAVYLGSETPAASSDSSSGSSSSGGSSSGSTSSGSTSSENTSSCGSAQASDPGKTFEENLTNQVKGAEPGATVVVEQGVTTLPNFVMKELLKRTDVSLKLEFTYQNTDYVIVIPAGQAVDNDIPLYGPLYLAQQYGNRAGTDASVGGTYEVRSGDCLSRIAAASNMTLQQLLAKNPQIKDPNKIVVGQKINR